MATTTTAIMNIYINDIMTQRGDNMDDFGFAGTSQALIDRVKKELAKTYELSCNPDMSSYLGLNIQRNRKLKQILKIPNK